MLRQSRWQSRWQSLWQLHRAAPRRWGSVFACAFATLAVCGVWPAHADRALAQGGPLSVAPVVETLVDSVVNIATAQNVRRSGNRPLPRVPQGSPFEDLFEDFFEGDNEQTSRKINSLGSGFVVDSDEGLIVTNNHVIEGADEITVVFRDGRRLKVDKVLGVDKKTDLALLKVTPDQKLASVPWGSSDDIRVGDWVLAIGNPFGLGGSVSLGIISAKQRDIRSGPYDDYLQTDAAINKGNSGGPLFNMQGEVIGVNTAIISPTGGSIGIGFAVPSDVAITIVDQLRRYGEVRRGWLGVNIQTVTEEIARSLKLKPEFGALVSSVTSGGPSEKAGLKPGDVIVKFNNRDVVTMRTLPRLVARTGQGQVVPVELLRDGQRVSVNIEIGLSREDEPQQAATTRPSPPDTPDPATPPPDKAPSGPSLGLKLAPVTPEAVATYKLKDGIRGVVIAEVETGSVAASRGLEVGEVIAEIGSVQVVTPEAFNAQVEAARAAARRSVLLRVIKPDGSFRFVALPMR
ncbi:MAG: Do family serine endopeptidase [Hyphomicrobiaceae bacterium]